jgi:hypothetical protein
MKDFIYAYKGKLFLKEVIIENRSTKIKKKENGHEDENNNAV